MSLEGIISKLQIHRFVPHNNDGSQVNRQLLEKLFNWNIASFDKKYMVNDLVVHLSDPTKVGFFTLNHIYAKVDFPSGRLCLQVLKEAQKLWAEQKKNEVCHAKTSHFQLLEYPVKVPTTSKDFAETRVIFHELCRRKIINFSQLVVLAHNLALLGDMITNQLVIVLKGMMLFLSMLQGKVNKSTADLVECQKNMIVASARINQLEPTFKRLNFLLEKKHLVLMELYQFKVEEFKSVCSESPVSLEEDMLTMSGLLEDMYVTLHKHSTQVKVQEHMLVHINAGLAVLMGGKEKIEVDPRVVVQNKYESPMLSLLLDKIEELTGKCLVPPKEIDGMQLWPEFWDICQGFQNDLSLDDGVNSSIISTVSSVSFDEVVNAAEALCKDPVSDLHAFKTSYGEMKEEDLPKAVVQEIDNDTSSQINKVLSEFAEELAIFWEKSGEHQGNVLELGAIKNRNFNGSLLLYASFYLPESLGLWGRVTDPLKMRPFPIDVEGVSSIIPGQPHVQENQDLRQAELIAMKLFKTLMEKPPKHETRKETVKPLNCSLDPLESKKQQHTPSGAQLKPETGAYLQGPPQEMLLEAILPNPLALVSKTSKVRLKQPQNSHSAVQTVPEYQPLEQEPQHLFLQPVVFQPPDQAYSQGIPQREPTQRHIKPLSAVQPTAPRRPIPATGPPPQRLPPSPAVQRLLSLPQPQPQQQPRYSGYSKSSIPPPPMIKFAPFCGSTPKRQWASMPLMPCSGMTSCASSFSSSGFSFANVAGGIKHTNNYMTEEKRAAQKAAQEAAKLKLAQQIAEMEEGQREHAAQQAAQIAQIERDVRARKKEREAASVLAREERQARIQAERAERAERGLELRRTRSEEYRKRRNSLGGSSQNRPKSLSPTHGTGGRSGGVTKSQGGVHQASGVTAGRLSQPALEQMSLGVNSSVSRGGVRSCLEVVFEKTEEEDKVPSAGIDLREFDLEEECDERLDDLFEGFLD